MKASTISIRVRFWSYFKDRAGCGETTVQVAPGTTLGAVHDEVLARYPGLAGTRNCTLLAVGVDYAGRDQVLREGDEVSLFPPVQGG